jgi:hypothetical protein
MGFAGAVGENFDVFASENIIDKRTVSRSMIGKRDPERCFIVKVRGNCLAGSHIIDGDDVTGSVKAGAFGTFPLTGKRAA